MKDRTMTCLLVGVPLAMAAPLITIAFADASINSDSGLFIGALVCVVFMVLGDAFIIGYGGDAMAGWNTYTAEEKSGFNERKIFQASGLMMSVGGIIIFIAFMARNWFSGALYTFIGIMFVWYVVMLIYINTSESFLSDRGKEEKMNKKDRR